MTTGRGSFSQNYSNEKRYLLGTGTAGYGQKQTWTTGKSSRAIVKCALINYAGENKQSLTLNQSLLEQGTGDKTSVGKSSYDVFTAWWTKPIHGLQKGDDSSGEPEANDFVFYGCDAFRETVV